MNVETIDRESFDHDQNISLELENDELFFLSLGWYYSDVLQLVEEILLLLRPGKPSETASPFSYQNDSALMDEKPIINEVRVSIKQSKNEVKEIKQEITHPDPLPEILTLIKDDKTLEAYRHFCQWTKTQNTNYTSIYVRYPLLKEMLYKVKNIQDIVDVSELPGIDYGDPIALYIDCLDIPCYEADEKISRKNTNMSVSKKGEDSRRISTNGDFRRIDSLSLSAKEKKKNWDVCYSSDELNVFHRNKTGTIHEFKLSGIMKDKSIIHTVATLYEVAYWVYWLPSYTFPLTIGVENATMDTLPDHNFDFVLDASIVLPWPMHARQLKNYVSGCEDITKQKRLFLIIKDYETNMQDFQSYNIFPTEDNASVGVEEDRGEEKKFNDNENTITSIKSNGDLYPSNSKSNGEARVVSRKKRRKERSSVAMVVNGGAVLELVDDRTFRFTILWNIDLHFSVSKFLINFVSKKLCVAAFSIWLEHIAKVEGKAEYTNRNKKTINGDNLPMITKADYETSMSKKWFYVYAVRRMMQLKIGERDLLDKLDRMQREEEKRA